MGGRVDDEGRLWGRGSCDMKGGIACGIVALRALRDLGIRLQGDVVFQSVVDEETGGPGTARAIERGHLADAAIVLEPTDGHLQPVEGGLEWIRVVIRGRTGHSAVRYRSIHAGGRGEPVSAIEKAVDVLLRHPRAGAVLGRPPRAPADAARYHHDQPRRDRGRLRRRQRRDAERHGRVLQHGRLLLARAVDEVSARRAAATTSARCSRTSWPASPPPIPGCASTRRRSSGASAASRSRRPRRRPSHPFCQTVAGRVPHRHRGGETFSGFEAVSDLAWLAHAGVPSMLYGPGDFAQAHSSAEFVRVDELVEVAGVVALALCDWCGC